MIHFTRDELVALQNALTTIITGDGCETCVSLLPILNKIREELADQMPNATDTMMGSNQH
jgi:hypothetical protein